MRRATVLPLRLPCRPKPDASYVDLLDPDVRFAADAEWSFDHEWLYLQQNYDGVFFLETSEAMAYIE